MSNLALALHITLLLVSVAWMLLAHILLKKGVKYESLKTGTNITILALISTNLIVSRDYPVLMLFLIVTLWSFFFVEINYWKQKALISKTYADCLEELCNEYDKLLSEKNKKQNRRDDERDSNV